MIFDSHAHYDDSAFDADRGELLAQMAENGIHKIVNVGASIRGVEASQALAEQYSFIYAAVGVHPDEVGHMDEQKLLWMYDLCRRPKTVAVGEIGLDYHWNSVGYGKDTIKGKKAIELQKKWFIKQIKLANELKLPVCIHSRDADKDTLEILKKHKPEYGAVIHCYAYGLETAKEYIDMEFYFGVGGTSTYKNNDKLIEALEYIPINKIVLETDCPYLTPEPKRRQRNDSGNISYVIENLAKIKNLTCDEIAEITTQNVKDVYNKIMYNMS